jgi:hypothetical protein
MTVLSISISNLKSRPVIQYNPNPVSIDPPLALVNEPREREPRTTPNLMVGRTEEITTMMDWRLETGDWRLETGDWRLETGDWRLETGDWRLETGLDGMRTPGRWTAFGAKHSYFWVEWSSDDRIGYITYLVLYVVTHALRSPPPAAPAPRPWTWIYAYIQYICT